MANTIALAELYKAALDEIYIRESLTKALEMNNSFVQATDMANTVKVAKIALQGLGDYDRANGFLKGDVTLDWEPYVLKHDRGRTFQVDAMDDLESLHLPTLNLMRVFLAEYVVPEVDASRFAKLADKSGFAGAGAIADAEAAIQAWDTALESLDDASVPREGRTAYLSAQMYYKLKGNKVTRERLAPGQSSNGYFETLDAIPVVIVPKNRFYTAISLLSGKDVEAEGGYKPGALGKAINFQIVHNQAAAAITKHVKPRIFTADENQTADATKFDYRLYHDLIVPEQKTNGIYTHSVA